MTNDGTTTDRPLTSAERALLSHLLRDDPVGERIVSRLSEYRVAEMNDGGMGSVRTIGDHDRTIGRTAAEAACDDADHTPMSIVINLDQRDELFEIDIWRIDFRSLQRYPAPENTVRVV
jgi:hypothetical protein